MIKSDNKWSSPRSTIASRYQGNDFGYSTHGAVGAVMILSALNILPSDANKMSFLDYGCGTGRHARILTPMFERVIGFDPTTACIEMSLVEIRKAEMPFPNLIMTSNFDDVTVCDVGSCISVLEHLNDADATILIDNLRATIRGPVFVTYSAHRNAKVMYNYLTDEQRIEDATPNAQIQTRVINFNKQEQV